ncbi:T9SS type A sorting domain-containing protein, partial [bacterium]|nr:T9SS type A sorting domain-containing protein [bacterium]
MTAIFSHPAVEGIVQWGFWEGHHWRPTAALYNQDWSARPVGEAFENLIFNEWRTETTVNSNEGGFATVNCFHGDYEITAVFESGGKYNNITETISVLPEKSDTLKFIIDNVTGLEEDIPAEFDFNVYNYPNPFNSNTSIIYSLPKLSKIELTIYNIEGQEVITLSEGLFDRGRYSTIWNGRNSAGEAVSSGIYFCRLKNNPGQIKVKKLLFLK